MSAVPESFHGVAANDADTQETREWLDALSAVIEAEGPDRAHFLLENLLEHARQNSNDMPFSANTGYVNTIEPSAEARCPGQRVDLGEELGEGVGRQLGPRRLEAIDAGQDRPEDDEAAEDRRRREAEADDVDAPGRQHRAADGEAEADEAEGDRDRQRIEGDEQQRREQRAHRERTTGGRHRPRRYRRGV